MITLLIIATICLVIGIVLNKYNPCLDVTQEGDWLLWYDSKITDEVDKVYPEHTRVRKYIKLNR